MTQTPQPHEHGPECVGCAGGDVAAELAAKVAEHGFTVVSVRQTDDSPAFAYTVGLHATWGTELLLLGLGGTSAERILTGVPAAYPDGPPRGAPLLGLIPRYAIAFEAVSADRAAPYVVQASEHAGVAVSPLQLVMPDLAGRLPYDAAYDTDFMSKFGPRLYDHVVHDMVAADLSALTDEQAAVLAALSAEARAAIADLAAERQLEIADAGAKAEAAIRAKFGLDLGGEDDGECPLPELGTAPPEIREACVTAWHQGLGESLAKTGTAPEEMVILGTPWKIDANGEHHHAHVIHTVGVAEDVIGAELVFAIVTDEHMSAIALLSAVVKGLRETGVAPATDEPLTLPTLPDGRVAMLRPTVPERVGHALVALEVRAEQTGTAAPRTLQLFVTDEDGRFAWDAGYDGSTMPLLCALESPAGVPLGVPVH